MTANIRLWCWLLMSSWLLRFFNAVKIPISVQKLQQNLIYFLTAKQPFELFPRLWSLIQISCIPYLQCNDWLKVLPSKPNSNIFWILMKLKNTEWDEGFLWCKNASSLAIFRRKCVLGFWKNSLQMSSKAIKHFFFNWSIKKPAGDNFLNEWLWRENPLQSIFHRKFNSMVEVDVKLRRPETLIAITKNKF